MKTIAKGRWVPGLAVALACAPAALAQGQDAQQEGLPAANPDVLEMPDDATHRADQAVRDGHLAPPAVVGVRDPQLLEVGEGETVNLPRDYDHRLCDEGLMRDLFAVDVDQAFLDSLRCYVVPVESSTAFAEALDQAIVAEGWEYESAAGQIVHYRRGGQTLDTRVFWLGDYLDEPTQDRGFLFGMVDGD